MKFFISSLLFGAAFNSNNFLTGVSAEQTPTSDLESQFDVSPITIDQGITVPATAGSFSFTTGLAGAPSPDGGTPPAIKVEVYKSPIDLPTTTGELTDAIKRSACFSRGGSLIGEIRDGINAGDPDVRALFFIDGSSMGDTDASLNVPGPNTDPADPTVKTFAITSFKDAIDAETNSGDLVNADLIRETEAATSDTIGQRVLEVLVCYKVTLISGAGSGEVTGVTGEGGEVTVTDADEANYSELAVTYTITLDGADVTPQNGAVVRATAIDPAIQDDEIEYTAVGAFCSSDNPADLAGAPYSDLEPDNDNENIAAMIDQDASIYFCIRGDPNQQIEVVAVLNAEVSASINIDGTDTTVTQTAVTLDGSSSSVSAFAAVACPEDFCVVEIKPTAAFFPPGTAAEAGTSGAPVPVDISAEGDVEISLGNNRRQLISFRADRTLQAGEAVAGFDVEPMTFGVDMESFQESSSSIAATTGSFLVLASIFFSMM